MKNISTLVKDIYEVIETGGGWDETVSEYCSGLLEDTLNRRLSSSREEHSKPTLRMSQMGQPCKRKLWYSINKPGSGSSLAPSTKFKFLYGDILEDLLISLAIAAGHKVEGMQDTLEVEGIKGHRDCVIDGVTVDVKSASSFAYKKFASGGLRDDDPFGYISQLSSYVLAGREHEVESHPTLGAFLVVDKQNGNICLDMYDLGPEIEGKIEDFKSTKEMVKQEEPPERSFEDVEDGKSGNRKLGIQCSYCDYKSSCWPELRTFLYSNGPKFLTKVEKVPNVPEVTK